MTSASANRERRIPCEKSAPALHTRDERISAEDKNHPDPPITHRPLPRNSHDTRTDEQLLADYQHGDQNAFIHLVERYQRELFHYLYRFLGDRATAEDMFQEAFLQVHQSSALFDPRRRFRPWLFTIAANKARDWMRVQARRPTTRLQAAINPGDEESGRFIDLMESPIENPEVPAQRKELQERIQKVVHDMPQSLREILLLSYFHQFSYKQIGEILNIPLGTVKSRLHTAVAHFAHQWRAANQNSSLT